jgi:hypothetical protein
VRLHDRGETLEVLTEGLGRRLPSHRRLQSGQERADHRVVLLELAQLR